MADRFGQNGDIIAALGALCLSAVCSLGLAACGGSGGETASTSPPAVRPEPETEPEPEPGAEPGTEPEDAFCDQEFSSTYDAVQTLIFDKHCIACHTGDDPSGGLDLSAGVSHANIYQQPSRSSDLLLVRAGSRSDSALWLKVKAWTDDSIRLTGGGQMPPGGSLSEKELAMLQFWLSGGAPGPEEGTLQGTEDAIAGCFPDPVPIQIRPLEAPAEGEGVQLEMPPYVLPASSEVEICFCSYVDMRDQIPAEFMTPDGKFFAYDQSEIRQTGASHHMLFFAPNSRLLGEDFDPNTFSDWTCAGGGNEGAACDPRSDDCGEGFCATPPEGSTACSGYGPANGTITNTFAGTQQPQSKTVLYPGVYRYAPTETVVCWNSHAFNLTTQDFEMNARLNFSFASDRIYRSRGQTTDNTFAIGRLIAEGAPPYSEETMCWDETLPQYARVTGVSSHHHKRGVRAWWTLPDGETILYENLIYNDPPEVFFDDPLKFDSAERADRTLRFCITYNNGVDENGEPDREAVTRASRIPYGLGGPGSNAVGMCEPHACVNEGADVTIDCDDGIRNRAGDDVLCDTSPGAGDGYCDACSITGGVTTENEMGQGSIQYFVVEGDE